MQNAEPSSLTQGQTETSQASESTKADLTNAIKRMSLSSAQRVTLPPSLPTRPSSASEDTFGHVSLNVSKPSSRPSLVHSPSAASLQDKGRPITPSLHKRASVTSLHEAQTSPRSPAVRRTSSYISRSPTVGNSSLPPVEETPKPSLTAASVAREFFERELSQLHDASRRADNARTVVILQDDCYGHRYSRPRTSKAGLNTIVERPERIHAALTGVAASYVRLGGRHMDGKAAPHPQRDSTSLPPVPFAINKTARRLSLQSPATVAVHGVTWMNELKVMCDLAESKLAMGGKELSRPAFSDRNATHSGDTMTKLHEGDLYLCSGSLEAFEGALGGVCEAVDTVFNDSLIKRAFVCIRPPGHHCSADMPSGFCWLNNVHVGISHASVSHGLTHAAIIDFDLHHGDGSQAITWAHNSRIASLAKNTPMSKKTSIGYFSLHDINSYPCEMGDEEKVRNASLCIDSAHGQSIWNVHLQPWKSEADFWALYESKYFVVLEKARAFLRNHSERLRQVPTHPKPKAAIFLSAGFDASEWESPYMQRHKVNVPTSFYARFSQDVVRMAGEEDLGVDGRVISVLEGGYSDRALMSGVLSHLSGLTTVEPFTSSIPQGRLDSDVSIRPELLDSSSNAEEPTPPGIGKVDPAWWCLQSLGEIENAISPKKAPEPPKKRRSDLKPTYTTATESYKAKIVSPPPGRRSFSGSILHQPSSSTVPRLPMPPPPDVDWSTATVELSRLLVPADRQTGSCKAEELNTEASKTRRDRHSGTHLVVETVANDPHRMRLREKRPKQSKPPAEEAAKPPSRASRRKTIADVKLHASEADGTSPLSEPSVGNRPIRSTWRRTSVASSAASVTSDLGSEYNLASIIDSQEPQEQFVVKKPRATQHPGPEAPRPRTAKKPAAASRTPSGSLSTKTTEQENTRPGTSRTDSASSVKTDNICQHQEVDQLAAGMKKMSIKLKVTSKEEQDTRQAKTKAAPRGKAATSRAPQTKSPVKARTKTTSPVKAKAEGSRLDVGAKAGDEASTSNPTKVHNYVPMQDEIMDSSASPQTPPLQTAKSATATDSSESQSVIDRALHTPVPIAPSIQQAQPSTTITVRRTKQDLPVFTSTSPINFGSKATAPARSGIDRAMDPPDGFGRRASSEPLVAHSTNGQINSMARPKNEDDDAQTGQQQKPETLTEPSIWDIPQTPKPKRA